MNSNEIDKNIYRLVQHPFNQLDEHLSLTNASMCNNFPLLVEDPKYHRIHPIKQRPLHALIYALINSEYGKSITEIIVFGSCLTLYCNSYSDMDVIVLGTFEDFNPTIPLYEFGAVDLFGYRREEFLSQIESNSFYKKVWEEGYKIYEQLPASS